MTIAIAISRPDGAEHAHLLADEQPGDVTMSLFIDRIPALGSGGLGRPSVHQAIVFSDEDMEEAREIFGDDRYQLERVRREGVASLSRGGNRPRQE